MAPVLRAILSQRKNNDKKKPHHCHPSHSYISQCVSTLSRRLGKTRSWAVALKTLILIHLSEGDPTYEQEIFFATRRGTRMLNLSDFSDTSRSDSWDYSAFVRTYARYLDEMLEFRMHGRRTRRRSRSQQMHEDWSEELQQQTFEDVRSTPVREMKIESIFARTQHLQQLLDRFLACRPTGTTKHHRIVAMALYPILKESTQLYFDLQEMIGVFVDRFMELEVPDCVRVCEIFTRLSKHRRHQPLKLLAALAAIRLDEKTDKIESILSSTLTDAPTSKGREIAANTDPLAFSSWEEIFQKIH